jgi:hypothetical protein
MAEEKEMSDFAQMHNKLSLVASYPPFTLDEELHNAFLGRVREAEKLEDFEEIVKEFEEEIEDADMYQKRYGDETEGAFEAQKFAAELAGISMGNDDLVVVAPEFLSQYKD